MMEKEMSITERINALRNVMKSEGIDVYLIPSADYHQSEYVGDYFKTREFISGFTGSAGTVVISQKAAGLWTDGRYFLQAEAELEESKICLYRMGEPEVPTIEEYLVQELPQCGTLGFDGRVVAIDEGQNYEAIVREKSGKIRYDKDLVDEIWQERPALSENQAFYLPFKYSGESVQSKLTRVRQVMAGEGANVHVITSLDDICWLLNIRGADVAYCPLVLSYAMVYQDSVNIFIEKKKLIEEIYEEFHANQIKVYPYQNIYEEIKKLGSADTLLIDSSKVNYALYHHISEAVQKIEKRNPTTLFKAIKNEVELDNIRKAHIRDGVAHTKFLYWLKMHIGSTEITELSASKKLEEFRAEQEGFISPSFAPICAYKEHAAIVHYESTPETDVKLEPQGLLLSDTGGHYYEGSTDITRTIALGPVTEEEKTHFTITAMSMLRLAQTQFLYGCGGYNLDAIARQPFWERGLDFKHGTGHGVGYLLNIHEGPNGFRWSVRQEDICPLEEGMITTDEPGIYITGSHGIRIENELLVRAGTKNEYGQFMHFEYLTYVPIDLDAIDTEIMSEADKKALNDYHATVYEKISPYLEEDERVWLKKSTRNI